MADLYIILHVLTSLCRLGIDAWDYPGVVEIISKLGVIVKAGGRIVLVGVDSQGGMINSLPGSIALLVRLLTVMIDSFETEKCVAILSNVSFCWTIYRSSLHSVCNVFVAVFWIIGVGIIGKVPSGAGEDVVFIMDCHAMNANITKATPINALRVGIKMLAPGFEIAFA